MTDNVKRGLYLAGVAIFWGALIYFWFPIIQPHVAADNFECDFDAESTENVFAFGGLSQPIKRITVRGHVDDPFEERLYDFSGRAIVEIEDQKFETSARGSVFIDNVGNPNGVLLTLENDRFGRDWLNIMTLNDDGILEFSEVRAYLFSDQSKGDPFRLSYPVTMDCSSTLAE